MSTLVTNNVQLGSSGTTTNNFTIYQPTTPDGTIRIGSGNSGTTSSLVTLNNTGSLTLPNAQSYAITSAAGNKNDVVTLTSGNVLVVGGGGATDSIQFWNQGVQRMTLDSSGNLGVGKVPVSDRGVLQLNGGIEASSMNGGQLAGMRNKIINGKMDIAQRGTTISGVTSGSPAYIVDRFGYNSGVTTAAVTLSQQLDGPSSNPEFPYSYRVTVTTADPTVTSTKGAEIYQGIEGFNARDLIGKTFTFSFWVRSSKTGIHCVNFRSAGDSRSFIAEYTINSVNTWEFKTVTVTGGLITAGTWNWTNGRGILVTWNLMCGSSGFGTAGTWNIGPTNASTTSNQVNCLDTVGNIFAITGVQLEVGTVATPFEHRPYGAELALCQRYTRRLQVNSAVGQVTSATAANLFSVGQTMRAAPTLSTSSGWSVSNSIGGAVSASSFAAVAAYDDGTVVMTATVASGLVAGNACYITAAPSNAVLSAEL